MGLVVKAVQARRKKTMGESARPITILSLEHVRW
jgi:hypothetical protein